MKKYLFLPVALLLLAGTVQALRIKDLSPDDKARAAAVERLLADIESKTEDGSRKKRSKSINEGELNSYIAAQLFYSDDPYVDSLSLKLLPRDRVEGRLFIDLTSLKIPVGLASGAEIFFSASFESSDGGLSIRMEKVFIGTQKVAPGVIDGIISIVSRASGYEPVRLGDRHQLPPGVEKLETRKGRLVIYY